MQRARTLAIVGLALSLCACGDPYGEVKEALSPQERQLFEIGARVANPCFTCHDVTGDGLSVGPPLGGLFGRTAGTAAGYAYSPALRGAGVVWNEDTLAAFLSDVSGSIPGNRMVSPSVRDPAQLRALVFFLRHATR